MNATRAVQIHAHVTNQEKRSFQTYAEDHHLAASSLAGLLIARALERSDLSLTRRPSKNLDARLETKITAHRISSRTKRDFEAAATALGLTESKLLRFLCMRELEERWLSRALTIASISDIDSN